MRNLKQNHSHVSLTPSAEHLIRCFLSVNLMCEYASQLDKISKYSNFHKVLILIRTAMRTAAVGLNPIPLSGINCLNVVARCISVCTRLSLTQCRSGLSVRSGAQLFIWSEKQIEESAVLFLLAVITLAEGAVLCFYCKTHI